MKMPTAREACAMHCVHTACRPANRWGRVGPGVSPTRSHRLRRSAIIASFVAIALLSGCGSSKHAANTTATATAAGAVAKIDPAFIARVDAVCGRFAKAAPQFPYPTFDPLHPDVKLLPKVGAFFAKQQPKADAVPKQLAALGPPATGQATWSQMLALGTRSRVVADQQIKAAEASNTRAFVATVNSVQQISTQLGNLADKAGFSISSPCRMIF